MPKDTPHHIAIPSPAIYFRLNSALAQQAFRIQEGDFWPSADLTNAKKTVKATAQMRPGTLRDMQMLSDSNLAKKRSGLLLKMTNLSDFTSDVLDAVTVLWSQQAHTPNDWAVISVDDIIRMRGNQRQSIKAEWREAIADQLGILNNIWVVIATMQVPEEVTMASGRRKTVFNTWKGESRIIHIDSRYGPVTKDGELEGRVFQVKMGEAFSRYLLGRGRQTALMAQKCLQLDWSKFWVEKRLIRLLSYLYRVRQSTGTFSGPFKVGGILDSIGLDVDQDRPGRARERFERALDRLLEERVIQGYRYLTSGTGTQHHGIDSWLQSLVEIIPPSVITEHYQNKIKQGDQFQGKHAPKAIDVPVGIAERLRVHRKQLGLTQAVTGKLLGVSSNWIALIERGREPSAELRTRIEGWLAENPAQL